MLRSDRVLLLPPVVCLLLAASPPPAFAQYRLDSFTTSNGLPQNTLAAIAQTRDGYLWIGTYDGLVRYDGVRFTVFDKGNTPAIHSTRFLSLWEDAAGALWAGSVEGGLVRYNSETEGLPKRIVYPFVEAPDGAILAGVSGIVARLSGGVFTATALPRGPRSLFVDGDGTVWIGSSPGLMTPDPCRGPGTADPPWRIERQRPCHREHRLFGDDAVSRIAPGGARGRGRCCAVSREGARP